MDDIETPPLPGDALAAHLHLLFGGYEPHDITHALQVTVPKHTPNLYLVTAERWMDLKGQANLIVGRLDQVNNMLHGRHYTGAPISQLLLNVTNELQFASSDAQGLYYALSPIISKTP